jgi:hypothetical protein
MDTSNTPFPVRRGLKQLGQDLRDARRVRRIPMWLAAERASISRATLSKIEKGDEGVSMGSYARIFFILSMLDKLTHCAELKFDHLGLGLALENVPKRIRIPRARRKK